MTRKFLALFGHVALDVTMKVDFFPTSGSVAVNALHENFGGTAGNTAMIAAKLGLPFHLYTSVGGKSHGKYLDFLNSIGADTAHLNVDADDMGPIGYAVSDGKEQIYYFYQGPMDKPLENRISMDQDGYEWLHFGTGLPSDYISIGRKYESSRIMFDPGQEINYRYDRETLEKLIGMAHTTILNESESTKAEKILGISNGSLAEHCSNLVITRGKEGSSFYHEGKGEDFPARLVENPFDTIGAGDAFRAGMYFALWKGMKMGQAIRLGSIVSGEAIKAPFRDFSASAEHLLKQVPH